MHPTCPDGQSVEGAATEAEDPGPAEGGDGASSTRTVIHAGRSASLSVALTSCSMSTGQRCLTSPGSAPIIAATLICEVGDPCRFAREAKFPRWSGTGAVAVSSGEGNNEPVRHRLDIGGNRRVNSMLYIISVIQQRDHPAARRYLAREAAEGKTRREARRAHKRQLANRIIRRVWRDEHTRRRRFASTA